MRRFLWIPIVGLQLAAMLGDAVLLIVVGFLLWKHFNILVAVLCAGALKVWYDNGALEAWRPSVMRRFFRNARSIAKI